MTDPDVRTPEEIASDIRSQIESGEWSAGTRVPEDALVAWYGCTREAIRRAMWELCREGVTVEVRMPDTAPEPDGHRAWDACADSDHSGRMSG